MQLCTSPFLQRFSLSPKILDTMIKKKYLIQIFAICVLRIIACRSFHTDVFSLCQNFGYNDKEEILETDICYLLPAYYCLQFLSYRIFLELSGFNCEFYHLHLFFLFADELHVFFLADFVPLSVCGLLIRRSRDCERFDIKTRKINILRNIFYKKLHRK